MFNIIDTDGTLVVEGAGEPVDLWDHLRRHYLSLRPGRHGSGGLRYPETTRRDVLAVVAIFNRELERAKRDVAGMPKERTLWRRAARRAADDAGSLDERYGDNAAFWLRDTKRLAVFLSVAGYLPTRTEMLDDLAALTLHAPGKVPKP
jgi:hypothetical protein